MIDYLHIYKTQSETYDQLVSREDYQGNIASNLAMIRPLAGLEAGFRKVQSDWVSPPPPGALRQKYSGDGHLRPHVG